MPARPPVLEYHSDNPNDDSGSQMAVRRRQWRGPRCGGFRLPASTRRSWTGSNQPLTVDNLGLVERERSRRGEHLAIKPAEKIDRVRTMAVPAVLMYAMFFVIMTTRRSLLNSVIEEKMSKISEVLLGSITAVRADDGQAAGQRGDRRWCWRSCT